MTFFHSARAVLILKMSQNTSVPRTPEMSSGATWSQCLSLPWHIPDHFLTSASIMFHMPHLCCFILLTLISSKQYFRERGRSWALRLSEWIPSGLSIEQGWKGICFLCSFFWILSSGPDYVLYLLWNSRISNRVFKGEWKLTVHWGQKRTLKGCGHIAVASFSHRQQVWRQHVTLIWNYLCASDSQRVHSRPPHLPPKGFNTLVQGPRVSMCTGHFCQTADGFA